MPRVAVLNNYSFDEVWKEVERKEKPDHHLYGINYFAARGYEVDIVPFRVSQALVKLSRRLRESPIPIPFGDLDQQWSLRRHIGEADLIYSPCQMQTQVVSYLRAAGIVKVPVVSIAHHPLNRGRASRLREPFVRLFVKGSDAFPALSRGVANSINALPGQAAKSCPLAWGPDADFYPYVPTKGRGVVAAGRTGRDFITFGLAASQTGSHAHIICLKGDVKARFEEFGPNVQVTVQPETGYMKYPDLLQIYAEARALAIPLVAGVSLSGLTSVMDALGMGKPLIMTRHPLIDIDIEAEGIGLWVDPGDVEGWRRAITFFEENEDEAIEMGRRARQLVDAGLNSKMFANQVMDILDDVLRHKRAAGGKCK